MLDVVFNHTAEGDQRGPYISYRGIDNRTYYILTPEGEYYHFSGCGNTLNCNHPVVRNMVLDCLRYWASEYHVDGFPLRPCVHSRAGSERCAAVQPPIA